MLWTIYQFLEDSYNFKLTALSPEIAAGYYSDGTMPTEPEPESVPTKVEEEIEEDINDPTAI